MSKNSKKQLKKDIEYLKKHLDNDKEINEVIEFSEKMGIASAQYFVKSLYFIPKMRHKKQSQDFTMLNILTLQNSTIIIG